MLSINWKSLVSGIMIGSLLFSGISYASPKLIKLIVNGKEIQSKVKPRIVDGSTLVSARDLAEALGAKVSWDEGKQAIVVENKAYAGSKGNRLSDQEAVQLAVAAQKHYWHFSIGGNSEKERSSFKVTGQKWEYYRWMGDDLNTKEKCVAYLGEVYVSEQAQAFINSKLISGEMLEIDGKMAQLDADGGSLRQWSESRIRVIQDEAKVKKYALTVPVGVDGYEKHELKLRYSEGLGWRIDQAVETIR